MSIIHFSNLHNEDIMDSVMFWNSGQVGAKFYKDEHGVTELKCLGYVFFSIDKGFMDEDGNAYPYIESKTFDEYQEELLENPMLKHSLDFFETELYYMDLYSQTSNNFLLFKKRADKLRVLINLICEKIK